jgi:hypothetical protein
MTPWSWSLPFQVKGFLPGDVGAVVHVYRDGQVYEVEFMILKGRPPQ